MIAQNGTLEISRSRLLHNVSLMQQHISPTTKLCATIKANAYGHGIRQITDILRRNTDISWVCLYSLPEAIHMLDYYQVPFNVLVLAPIVLTEASPLLEIARSIPLPIRLNVIDAASAQYLSHALRDRKHPIPIHIQIETGLTRMGADPHTVHALADTIASLHNLRLEGVFAHFSHGDVPDHDTVRQQLQVLHQIADPLKERYPHLMIHHQNSGGAWHMVDELLDMVRVGIALYGLQPSMSDRIEGLLPIARVTAPIFAIHERPAGTGVGYGHTFVAKRQSRLAVVPVGYAEGYPRAMSNRGVAQVGGVDVPVVGRVSMDQIVLDVTDVAGASVGDMVTVISWEPEKANCLDRMAEAMGTIGYELATHMGAGGGRLRRVIVD